MTPAGKRLAALRIARPEEWGEIVRGALEGRSRAAAAEEMGVGLRTCEGWCAELGIKGKRGGKRVGAGARKKQTI